MAKAGVNVVSKFFYRGADEEFSNLFHFTGTAPSDSTGWIALCAAFMPLFRALVPSTVTVERIYCYTDTDHDSVYTYNLADHGGVLAGTLAITSGAVKVPGDDAYWARWTTGRNSTKGKPVYLRKYFHPGYANSSDHDQFDPTMRTAVQSAAAAIAASSGAWPGMAGPSYDLSSPVAVVSNWLTTRSLKRRGKRPH